MSRCVTPTPERFGPGARDFWVNFGNNVDEGFGAVILPDGADRLADVIVIRMAKSLIVNTKSGQGLIPVTRKMAAEGQTIHRGSKSLGFCDCEVIDRVGVRPLAQPEGGDPSETPAWRYKLISKRNKNTKRTNDRAHARFRPRVDNGSIPAKTSANSTIACKTSTPEPGTTRDKRPSKRSDFLWHQPCALKAQVYATATRFR